ncbi:MAG: ABC transporter ATP-binding protein [Ruminococcus sp.]|nr:ABC transporter ATP-binding protein [Ruminococcus sp.]
MAELLLETNGLCKSYGKTRAVNNVSMHVERGAVYGFIGRNGAGKTTFMKIICGLANKTSGELTLFGKTGSQIAEVRPKLGCLIEAPGIYPKLTAFENMQLKCLAFGKYSKEYINDLLTLVGLADTGKKKAGKFSLGMRQRLGIALALVGDPELMVLDEPINGLDPQGIVEVRDTIHRLSTERGITILISSHILDELSRIATHYGIINNGELIRELSAEQLKNECSERLEITIKGAAHAAANILEKMGVGFTVVNDDLITVSSGIERSAEINTALVTSGQAVSELAVRGEALEDYYLNLTGGSANA